MSSDLANLSPEELAELDRLLLAETPILPHLLYQTDPIGWAVDKLGIPEHTVRWSLNVGYDGHAWDGTPDPLAAAFEAIRDWRDVAIESGTGTGKSYGVAILILWFLACFEDSECYTFAPTEDQLKLYIWKNINELWPRFQAWFPTAQLTSLTIRMRGGTNETWSAHGRAVAIRAGEDISTRAAGMHAEHMLLVYEETPGIDPSVLAAGKNTCTAPHNLRIAIGNPNHQLDALHLMSQEAGVNAIRMSALDHPNVVTRNHNLIPGAVSQVSIDRRRLDYGETSPVYQSRVRGVSPEQASDALIRLEWLKASRDRWESRVRSQYRDSDLDSAGLAIQGVESRETRQSIQATPGQVRGIAAIMTTVFGLPSGKGVDVANSEHGDRAAVVDFAGNACVRIDAFACPNANLLGASVVQEARAVGLDASRVAVDAIGVGAGTVNEARRLGFHLIPLYAGGKPMRMAEKTQDGLTVEWSPDVNLFENLRGQMYWQAREDLRLGRIDSPYDKELWDELVAHTFDDQSKVVKVLSKDKVKEQLGRSPDKADAWVMANWVRERSVVVEKEPPYKIADRARPLIVKDGKAVKPEPEPRTLEELVNWAQSRKRGTNRVPGFTQRVPRKR